MLRRYEIILDIKEKDYNIYNYSSLLQGCIMENIPTKFAEILHNMHFNLYSQYVFNKDNKCIWSITTIGEEAYKNIIEDYILNVDSVNIKHKNMVIDILEKKLVSQIDFQELFKKWYFNTNPSNRILINLKTPVSYKVNNRYQIIPDISNILSNLVNKWNSFNEKNQISEEILEEYINRTYIESYNLKSTKFSIEGIRINSFIGRIGIKINSNETMMNLLNMLFEFAEYVGIGIKSSAGMGGIEIVKK